MHQAGPQQPSQHILSSLSSYFVSTLVRAFTFRMRSTYRAVLGLAL